MITLDPIFWRDLVGLPYRHMARGPDAYDCFGLLVEVFRRRGITIPDAAYGDDPTAQTNALMQNIGAWREINLPPREQVAGAGVMFRRGLSAAHVGVAIDEDRFIHASEDHGQVLIGYLSRGYDRKILGVYEYAV